MEETDHTDSGQLQCLFHFAEYVNSQNERFCDVENAMLAHKLLLFDVLFVYGVL